MAVALILVLVALGSVLFHLVSPWWWTPIASNWRYIDDTIIITFWITGAVFVAIVLFMAYCVYRFRHQAGRQAHYEPENKKLEWWLTLVTAIGVAAMLTPGLFVWRQFITVPEDATDIEVVRVTLLKKGASAPASALAAATISVSRRHWAARPRTLIPRSVLGELRGLEGKG